MSAPSSLTVGPAGATASLRYRRTTAWRAGLAAVLALAGLAAIVLDLIVGSGTLPLAEVVGGLLFPAAADPTTRVVLWGIRAPMTAAAAIAGLQLALAGSLMQTTLNNPLAEPFTLGISSAAGFGAALAIVFGTSLAGIAPWLPAELVVAGNAFLFSVATVLIVTGLAARSGLGVETITLLGIAVHFVFSALLAFAQYVADPNQLQSLVFWLLGSLLRATWTKVAVNGVVTLLVLPVVLAGAWALTALRGFGDGAAVLGLRVERLRIVMLLAAALLAGSATATIGVVGFIGLAAPHMARLLVGEDQRLALPVTAFCGVLLLTAASLASKVILPGVVLPVGMVTALLGIPVFMALILRRRVRRA